MGLRINTNVPSLVAQRAIQQNTDERTNVLGQMSSGSRITSAADDAAGLAISEKLKANIRSSGQANRNANDGISLIQTAEGGLNEISNILMRLRELSVQSSSDTVGDTERQFSDLEFQNLKDEIQRISSVTQYNGTKLLNGKGGQFEFQVGIGNEVSEDRVSYDAEKINATLDNLKLGDLAVATKTDAQSGLSSLDEALTMISAQRAELGAKQNRLASTSNNLQVSIENLSAANSRIRDTDYAETTARNTQLNILANASTSVLAQANAQSQNALRLVG